MTLLDERFPVTVWARYRKCRVCKMPSGAACYMVRRVGRDMVRTPLRVPHKLREKRLGR